MRQDLVSDPVQVRQRTPHQANRQALRRIGDPRFIGLQRFGRDCVEMSWVASTAEIRLTISSDDVPRLHPMPATIMACAPAIA
jgi:hypothetical protein